MTNRILFVDDDAMLLKSFERNLSFEYDIVTAEGGHAAIEKVKSQGPFSVTVVDMRMPGMDGIQTIQSLRRLQKNTVYLMLSGNQDYETVLRALNDGEVFKFLNKPCSVDRLRAALDGAQAQFDLVASEKSLLQETLVGSINVLANLIELQDVRFFDCNEMVNSLKKIARQLNLDMGWEETIAARVCLAGMVLLPNEERQKLYEQDARHPEHQSIVNRVCQKSALMIEKIPRMSRVAKILNSMPEMDGFLSSSLDPIELHAKVLRGVFYWHLLGFRGFNRQQAIVELMFLMPNLSEIFRNALESLPDFQTQAAVEMKIGDLQPGMVLSHNLYNNDKHLILASDRRLTETQIDNLQRISDTVPATCMVAAGSCVQS